MSKKTHEATEVNHGYRAKLEVEGLDGNNLHHKFTFSEGQFDNDGGTTFEFHGEWEAQAFFDLVEELKLKYYEGKRD